MINLCSKRNAVGACTALAICLASYSNSSNGLTIDDHQIDGLSEMTNNYAYSATGAYTSYTIPDRFLFQDIPTPSYDGVSDISFGANGTVVAIGSQPRTYGHNIYRLVGNQLQQIPGEAERVAVGPQGAAWVANKFGEIFVGNSWGAWTKIDGLARDIGVGGNGTAFKIGLEEKTWGGTISRWDGSRWIDILGEAHRVAVDSFGRPWVTNKYGSIFFGDGWGGWTHIPNMLAKDIGVGLYGDVYVVGMYAPHRVYYLKSGAWHEAPCATGESVSVDYYGLPWVTDPEGNLIKGVANKAIAISAAGGNQSQRIKTVVSDIAEEYGIDLTEGYNWLEEKGDAVASSRDKKRIRDAIGDLSIRTQVSKRDIRLMLFGKSAGGVLSWGMLEDYFSSYFSNYSQLSLSLVDPHGSVNGDGVTGPYKDTRPLWWPSGWSTSDSYFRVFNTYQHQKGFTGASFPSSNVHVNEEIKRDVDHYSIETHSTTKKNIRKAFDYACFGR